MDSHKLPDHVAAANARFGWFTFVLQILRRQTNRDKGEHARALADRRAAVDDAMGFKMNVIFQFHFVINDAIWTNVAAGADACAWTNNRGGVDVNWFCSDSHEIKWGRGMVTGRVKQA
jgi:hypothetical protein